MQDVRDQRTTCKHHKAPCPGHPCNHPSCQVPKVCHIDCRVTWGLGRNLCFLTCPCVHVRLPLQPCIFSQATAFRILACSPKRTLLMCSPLGALWAHACRFHACSNRRAHASRVRVRVQPVIQPWFLVCGKSCACFSFERITTNIFVQHRILPNLGKVSMSSKVNLTNPA